MTIICGTDFSEAAGHAATAAACIAQRTGSELHLVHAIDLQPEALELQPGHPLLLWAEGQLTREADRLRELGVTVRVRAVAGHADRLLQDMARDVAATLVVVGAVGHRGNASHQLGSRADRTAQRAHVPVLAVRQSAAFLSWLKGDRVLRVLLGADASESAESAACWLDSLCRAGSVDLTLAHLYWPPETFYRLGVQAPRSFVEPHPDVVQALEQELSRRLDRHLHAKIRTYRIEPRVGPPGDGLAALAAELDSDLIVVGCRAIGPLEKLWDGSVARQTLHAATVSVACVPTSAVPHERNVPKLRQVIAATDFSELGNAAIPLAYAAVGAGGTVHLLHVLRRARPRTDPRPIFQTASEAATGDTTSAAHKHLSQLVPTDGSGKSVSTELIVVEAAEPWEGICQTAERVGADLVCLGTHGRHGLAQAAFGSVAAHVLAHSRRPLLFARAPRP